MRVAIGAVRFPTKAAAKKHVTDLIRPYMGKEIHETSGPFELLCALWARSPEWVDGASHFVVGKKFDGVGIKAVAGNKAIDWSISMAISGRASCAWTCLTMAMRNAIRPQVVEFRRRQLLRCVMCGCGGKMDVDHVVPFKTLMGGYLSEKDQVRPEAFNYTSSSWQFRDEDREWREGWEDYHAKRCKLRVLCVPCHVKHTKETRRSDSESSAGESE